MAESSIQRAANRSLRLYPNAKHFAGAYMDGAKAKLNGKARDLCPYRADSTWARAWRRAWLRGYDSIEEGDGDG